MTDPTLTPSPRGRRTQWLGGVFVAVMWGIYLAGLLLDIQTFAWFLWTMAIDVVMTLAFLVWWFTRGSFSWVQRLIIPVCALGFGILMGWLTRHTIAMPPFLVLAGVPILLAVWWLAAVLTPRLNPRARFGVVILCLLAAWSPFLLIRLNGYRGNLQAEIHWRWTPTGEQLYLAQNGSNAVGSATTLPTTRPLELRAGDWPGFRGPARDAVVHNLRIATDWFSSPPKTLWRQRVGPGWSSMAVVDGFVFTQEQRGQNEAVVCRDALNGSEVWVHEDPVRFEEAMSGVGPRATPTFSNNRIYVQGTFGALHCLDATTGRVIWSRDMQKDADAPMPMWGFSDSPLVLNDRVIVFAGGEAKKGLLAYAADDGKLLWTADAGKTGYASPQSFEGPGGQMILMFTDEGLFCVDPATGKLAWQYQTEKRVGLPAALQACPVAPGSWVLGNGAAFGAQRIELSTSGPVPIRQWITPRMKPAFSDMVFHDGYIYGFDGTVFCCVDAATGERRWREGRYGAGEVLLLGDQGLLIVTTEDGEVVLLRCNPQRQEELGHIQAITGKAWNHPAIAGDRLYVRSDQEMACLQLRSLAQAP